MKAVIQRVTKADVTVDGETIGSCGHGFMVLLGITPEDTRATADLMLQKIVKLRIFCDENDKMNLSLTDIHGELLVISQFTLCADLKKGNRPSFVFAARPEKAVPLYEYFMEQLTANGVKRVEHGVFGADMAVEINNDGPVTIIMDTTIWRKN